MKVPIGFSGFGIRLISRSAFGILKAYWGRDSGLKECTGCRIPKTTLGITELGKIWVGITGLKNPVEDPHESPAEEN